MQHVIFARDRRRKKNRVKALIFLMSIICVCIGILLVIKNQQAEQPAVTKVVTATSEVHSPNNKDIAGTDSAGNPDNGDPNYVYIEIDESDDHEESNFIEDTNATSYEDELAAHDDHAEPKDAATISGEILEDLSIMFAQGKLQVETEGDKAASGDEKELVEDGVDLESAPKKPRHYSYTVTRGDGLRDVLEQSGLPVATIKALERKFPQFANLKAGQQFQWGLDAEGELEYINWLVSEKEEQIFERKGKNAFAVRVIEKKGVWKQDVVKGTISGDFISSMKGVGLSARQIQQLSSGLQWQISTNRLKKGDKFAILVKREYINDKVTDLGNVEAIHVMSGKKSYYAIQADNGRYYSRHGETLGKGFARHPLQFTPRVSSQFNPRRLHPVTRRVAPHKGVDFAVPSGTLIIAPADGVVEHIAYQARGAGRYIKIRHGGQYTTVYMHLSKSLVKVGQSVKKGDRIALSGNTGRSTGAHLHYEFHINGNPVNPMTVKLPGTGSGMPDSERKAFLAKAKSVEAKLKL